METERKSAPPANDFVVWLRLFSYCCISIIFIRSFTSFTKVFRCIFNIIPLACAFVNLLEKTFFGKFIFLFKIVGLQRFGLRRFGLRRFGLRRFGLQRFGLRLGRAADYKDLSADQAVEEKFPSFKRTVR